MGWLIAIPALIAGCILGNNMLIIASGLFAIAGSIGTFSTIYNQRKNESKDKTE